MSETRSSMKITNTSSSWVAEVKYHNPAFCNETEYMIMEVEIKGSLSGMVDRNTI